MPLTDVAIKNLKPAAKAKKYADGEGLFLYVTTTGTRSWRFRYRNFAGIEKEITFGLYPTVSLQDARKRRFETRKLLVNGKDPVTEKREIERAAILQMSNTFESIAKEWHELNCDKWSEKHQSTIMFRLKRYAIAHFGNRVISEITALDILDMLRAIEREKKFELCHRLLQYMTGIFRLAVLTQRASYNPCVDLKGVLRTGKVTHRPTIKINELPTFLKQLENCEVYPLDKLAIKMLVLTFVRPGELRKAKWEYFDFEKKLWYIPAELMKMRQEHIVPLASQTIELLKEIKSFSGDSEYLFPTKNKIKYPYMNENVINDVINKIGYGGKLVAHGFRSLASTTLNELGFAPDVIEKQLAHSERNQVRAAYNRAEYLPQRVEMMQGWGDYIDSIIK